MIKNVIFKKKQLSIIFNTDHQKDIDVGVTIYQVVFTHKRVVVLLNWEEFYDTEFHNRNIVCYDEQGKLAWRVGNPDLLSISKARTPYAFTNITLKEKNKIEAFKADCYIVDIDINTGKFVSDWEFTK